MLGRGIRLANKINPTESNKQLIRTALTADPSASFWMTREEGWLMFGLVAGWGEQQGHSTALARISSLCSPPGSAIQSTTNSKADPKPFPRYNQLTLWRLNGLFPGLQHPLS
jgi:hypothetical protein